MNPLLAFIFHLPFGFTDHGSMLVVIFAFVLCVIIIKQISRYQRARLWHDTARLALEKGQPLPADAAEKLTSREFQRRCATRFGRDDHWCYLRRGLIQLAVGVALYIAMDEGRMWALIPGLIGVANLIAWAIFSLRPKSPEDRRDPPTQV